MAFASLTGTRKKHARPITKMLCVLPVLSGSRARAASSWPQRIGQVSENRQPLVAWTSAQRLSAASWWLRSGQPWPSAPVLCSTLFQQVGLWHRLRCLFFVPTRWVWTPALASLSSWRCSGSSGHQADFAVAQAAGVVGLSSAHNKNFNRTGLKRPVFQIRGWFSASRLNRR
jgi:hypothetical protein